MGAPEYVLFRAAYRHYTIFREVVKDKIFLIILTRRRLNSKYILTSYQGWSIVQATEDWSMGKEVQVAPKKKKMKSPNYPGIGLAQAINLVRELWNKERRTPVTEEVAVKDMGYTSLNGATRTYLSALRKYGLIEGTDQGVRVSELGMRILHSPEGSPEYQKALQEAALKPELFRELYQTHIEASDENLKSFLILNKQFSPAGAKQCISAFRDTVALAKPLGAGYDAGKQGVEAMAGTTHSVALGETSKTFDSMQAAKPGVRVFSWPLPNDTIAELRLTGGPITQEHLEMLRQYLELAKAAVPKASEENRGGGQQ
jgi:hypothetical protein